MLEAAKARLSTDNITDIELLNKRIESLQDQSLECLKLHNQIAAEKNVHSIDLILYVFGRR